MPAETLSEQRIRRIKTKELEQRTRRIKMKELCDKGHSNVAIANQMGVSESTVRRVLKHYNTQRG